MERLVVIAGRAAASCRLRTKGVKGQVWGYKDQEEKRRF
jgi:hypothetical protein